MLKIPTWKVGLFLTRVLIDTVVRIPSDALMAFEGYNNVQCKRLDNDSSVREQGVLYRQEQADE